MRRRLSAVLASCLTLLAVAGCTGSLTAATPPPVTVKTAALPTHGLWQVAMTVPAVVGTRVIGEDTGTRQLVAVDAATGHVAWRYTLTGEGTVARIVGSSGVVVVETTRTLGTAPAAVTEVVAGLIALDATTGRQLWTMPIGGSTQQLPLAFADGLLVVGDSGGGLQARRVLTGAVIWSQPRPASCPPRDDPDFDEAIAADGALLTVSYVCRQYDLVRRLDPATGAQRWQWQSAASTDDNSFALVTVVGAAEQGQAVVLAGQVGNAAFRQRLVKSFARQTQWPRSLGPAGRIDVQLTLDARTGTPRWAELGAQEPTVALTAGATCEVVAAGIECRDDMTGQPTRATILTRESGSGPTGNSYAGIVDGRIHVIVGPLQPTSVTIDTLSVRSSRRLARTVVPVSTVNPPTSDYTPFVQTAVPLPSGRDLVLFQGVDVADYPLLAVAVGLS